MADKSESFSQALLLPSLDIDHEPFGNIIPLMGLSCHVSADSPEDERSDSLDLAFRHEAGSECSGEYPTAISPTDIMEPSTSKNCMSSPPLPLETTRDPRHPPFQSCRFDGWRMGVLIGCCTSFVVLCCNIAMIIVGVTSKSGYVSGGIRTIYERDEVSVTRVDTALHIVINVLSTALLSASNYTMQVLSSPTRAEVDAAHARGSWLDIGILSPRNLRAIAKKRVVLWLTLLLSSVPLHLLYNASVFKVTITPPDRVKPCDIIVMNYASKSWEDIRSATDHNTWAEGQYINITLEGFEPWPTRWPTDYGDMYFAIDQITLDARRFPPSSRLLETIAGLLTNETVLNSTLEELKNSPGNFDAIPISQLAWWETDNTVFEGAYASLVQMVVKKRSMPPSRVQVSLHFLIVVVCFNVLKLVIFLYVLITDRSAYMVTLGDAASSFIEHTDPQTKRKCVLGRDEIIFSFGHLIGHQYYDDEERKIFNQRLEGQWHPHRQPYEQVVKFSLLWLLVLVILIFSTGPSWIGSVTWRWGSDSNHHVYISHDSTVAATLLSALLANIPQLLVSSCHFTVNRLCTSIAVNEEWSHFATSRKGLRVTTPSGHQRSTHFLQLPYRWSIPLIATSATLHRLVSQSFFFVRVDDMRTQTSISACGFSFLSLLVLFMAFLGLLFAVCVAGDRVETKYTPLAASCSLAISAACHPAPEEVDAHLAKVRWGVASNEVVPGFGHCSLSSKPITEPEDGKTYF